MFRFSCFHSPTNSQKPKKTVHLPTEAMQKTLEDYDAKQPKKDSISLKEVHEGNNTNRSPGSMVQDWKSEGLKSVNGTDSEDGHKIRLMRKSMSLGSGLAQYQDMSSCDEFSTSHGNCSTLGGQIHDKDENPNHHQASVCSQISSNLVNRMSDVNPDCLRKSEKEGGANSDTRYSGEGTEGSSDRTPLTPHGIVKSTSLPYLHLSAANVVNQSRSSDDKSVDNDVREGSAEQETEDESSGHTDKKHGDDGEDVYEYEGSAKDWIVPTVDKLGKGKSVQEDYSVSQWEELPIEDFKIKRIEKWVMDLQHCSSLKVTKVLTDLDHHGQTGKNTTFDSMAASKNDVKSVLGTDAAKRYISSLSSSSTAAQHANHGLVAIPFLLSSFLSLRALNLSGNSIVRVTAGALPRGLHILNLSKNSISIIEGLRELTRLRVLDLSYNRILRIGHGLASCSSLKELYLAGNKISDVEGLHRLLKLNVLDLRFNKLSTTKSLGQLAANYNSLQAISLEGNPAQKNIGDEQLKKFLLGVLPHLAYLNRQSIKSGAMKNSADRAARLGISAHQIERGVRSEMKKSMHGRKSQPRGRNARLPPSGVRLTGSRHRCHDVGTDGFSFRPDFGIRKSHSEGLLKAV